MTARWHLNGGSYRFMPTYPQRTGVFVGVAVGRVLFAEKPSFTGCYELQVEQSDLWMKIGRTISQQSWFEFDAINIRYDMTAEKNDERVPELEQGAASLLQCHAASR